MYLLKNFFATLTFIIVSLTGLNAQSFQTINPADFQNIPQSKMDYIKQNSTDHKVVKGWYQSLVSAGHMYQAEANLVVNFHKNNINGTQNEHVQKMRLKALAQSLDQLHLKSEVGKFLTNVFLETTKSNWETYNSDEGASADNFDANAGTSGDSNQSVSSESPNTSDTGRDQAAEIVIVAVAGMGAAATTGAAIGAITGAALGPPGSLTGAGIGAVAGAIAGVAGGCIGLISAAVASLAK